MKKLVTRLLEKKESLRFISILCILGYIVAFFAMIFCMSLPFGSFIQAGILIFNDPLLVILFIFVLSIIINYIRVKNIRYRIKARRRKIRIMR